MGYLRTGCFHNITRGHLYWFALAISMLLLLTSTGARAAVVEAHADTVQRVYIAYYGRPADPAGLDYWSNRLEGVNGNLDEIIESFANSPEAQLLYQDLSDSEKVNTIYQQLFGRNSEPVGLAYYTDRLSSDASSHASIMLDVLYGAQDDDATNVNNKLVVARKFTAELDTTDENAAYDEDNTVAIRSWFATVSADTNPDEFNTDIFSIPDVVPPGTGETSTGRLMISNPNAPDNLSVPLRNITYSTSVTSQTDTQTNDTGEFEYQNGETITFELLGESFGPLTGSDNIDQHDLAASYCQGATDPTQCSYNTAINIQRTLLSMDEDQDNANGITLYNGLTEFPVAPDTSIDEFELALGKTLLKDNRQAAAVFKPSLGINLEEPQPEADDVGGQPIPFVDIFRIGRPFPEYSCSEIVYDEYGWPVEIPESCANEVHSTLNVPSYATTIILRYLPDGALPTGKYTVLYDGTGDIQYSGIATKLAAESVQGRDIIEITDNLLNTRSNAGLRVQIKDITAGDHIRNMRIIMPGGTCEGNRFIRVDSASECPTGDYQSFVDRLEQNRNDIIFNPAYLRFLKDYKVIRTMNLMKASPRNPCYQFTDDEEYNECLLQDFTWEQRAKLDDAMWGGSYLTDLADRAHRGVPLEVTVELVNQLQRDPWFNLPHNATDDYIEKYAAYVRDNLNPALKANIEYSNETWNDSFWATFYVREKGKDLNDNPYWGGAYYYATRASEVFSLWQQQFGGTDRLVRIIGSYDANEWLSRNLLNYNGTAQNVDVLAVAPYVHGCWNRNSHPECADTDFNPMTLSEVTSVDDIFEILDDPGNRYGLDAKIVEMATQAEVASEFGVDLYAYEGGQHLTVQWGDSALEYDYKRNLLELFRAANRDPRMSDLYVELLNGWKESGGQLFALYTMPQTYHTFGSFGIKEHLAQPRDDAPKYDGSMRFQEEQRKCWWDNCE